MFIIELLIYILFAWVMYSIAQKSDYQYGEDDNIDKYLWCYMLFFALISAIRWQVGKDSVAYINIFKNGEIRDGSQEYLWDFLVAFVHNYGLHFTVGVGIAAFCQIFFLTKTLTRYKYLLVWLPVVLFGGRYYLDLMNGVRQMIVACGFVWLSIFIVDKKPLHYFIGILLLSLIHHSGILLFAAYGLTFIPKSRLKLSNHRYVCLTCLILCFIIGQTPSYQSLAQYFVPMLSNFGYDNHTEFITQVLSGNTNEGLSLGPIMISTLLIGFAFIWYSPILFNEFGDKIPYFDLWYFFAFIFSCLYFLTCNVSHMLIRPTQYLEFFQVIMLCMLLLYFYERRAELPNHFYILIFVIWLCTLTGVYKDTGRSYEFTTYKTFFFHQ